MRKTFLPLAPTLATAPSMARGHGSIVLPHGRGGPMRDARPLCPDDNLLGDHDGTLEWALAWEGGFDQTGAPGHSRTRAAPGIGFPEGWQDPAVALGVTVRSMGIGVHFIPDPPTPGNETSWGQAKRLFTADDRS